MRLLARLDVSNHMTFGEEKAMVKMVLGQSLIDLSRRRISSIDNDRDGEIIFYFSKRLNVDTEEAMADDLEIGLEGISNTLEKLMEMLGGDKDAVERIEKIEGGIQMIQEEMEILMGMAEPDAELDEGDEQGEGDVDG